MCKDFKEGDAITLKDRTWKVVKVEEDGITVQMYEDAKDDQTTAKPKLFRPADHTFPKLGPPVKVPWEWVYPKNMCTYCNRELQDGGRYRDSQIHFGCWHQAASEIYSMARFFDGVNNIHEHKGCPSCGRKGPDGKLCSDCKQMIVENQGEQHVLNTEKWMRELHGYPEPIEGDPVV